MKKFLFLAFMSFSIVANAGIFSDDTKELKLFKEYPFDIHKAEFLKNFRMFGECENSDNRICAPNGIERLFGVKFNINIVLENNRTKKVQLMTTSWINKASYMDIGIGFLKSGFVIYDMKDKTDEFNPMVYEFNKAVAKSKGEPLPQNSMYNILDRIEKERNGYKATIRYMDADKYNSAFSGKFSSIEQIKNSIPKSSRFVTLEINKISLNDFVLIITFEYPYLNIRKNANVKAEKF